MRDAFGHRVYLVVAMTGLLALIISVAAGAADAAGAARAFRDVGSNLSDPVIRNSVSSRQPLHNAADLLTVVQEWLIWTGHYNGTIDGNLGDGTSDGIRKFQASINAPATGMLSVPELRILAERGSSQSKVMGFSLHGDTNTGVRLGIPKTYLSIYRSEGPTSIFESGDRKAQVVLRSIPSSLLPAHMRDTLLLKMRGLNVTYSAARQDWFVIAGRANGRQYYLRFQKVGASFSGFMALYEDGVPPGFANALTMMSLTLDTPAPNVFAPQVSNFESLVTLISLPAAAPMPAPESALSPTPVDVPDAIPLMSLSYDGKTKVTTTFRELTATLDSVKSPGQADLRDPVARLNFTDGRSQVIVIPDHGDETPASELKLFVLDKSRPFPQAVFTYYWNGAHCCTVTQIITTGPSNNIVVVSPDALDGGGYRFRDLDNDGNVDLLSADNSFYYAFASYAESVAPPRIHNLQDGVLVDVTQQPQFRGAIALWLNNIESVDKDEKANNGYWAGWVATKAELGQFRDAWAKMLSSYDRESTWSLQECLQGPLDKCSEDKLRTLEFPEALAKHLVKAGYISAPDAQDAMELWQRQRVAAAPKTPAPQPAPRHTDSSLDACTSAKPTVERIVGSQLIGRKIKPEDDFKAVSAQDNVTLDGVDDKIGKTLCSVTVDVDLRTLVVELASHNEMRAASQMSQLAARRGAALNRRVRFSVQPTSTPGQTWIIVLP